MRLAQLAELCDGQLVRGDPAQEIARISIDSRSVHRGDCFVALRGARFDGHEFIADAARLGASAAVVSDPTRASNSPSALALLQVQDTLTALHKLATNYRRLMPPTTRVVAVTGSCGKTTTKDLIAAVLGERFSVVKTDGNRNNHIGAPLNLLRLDATHDFGVFEVGTSHPGEIKVLADLVRPEIAVITNVGLAHVEFLGDEAGVAAEKGALLEGLPHNGDGLAVLNADDRWCAAFRARTRAAVVTVGIENFADIRASDIQLNGAVKFRLNIAKKREDVIVRLRTLGRHQIYNALQAAAVGYFAGMDLDEIRAGLETAEWPGMRMEPVTVNGVCYLKDCYNANLPSMRAAVRTLAETPCAGRRIAVLGDMLELGAWSATGHAEIGRLVAESRLDLLLTVGAAAKGIAEAALAAGMEMQRVLVMDNVEDARDALGALARAGDVALLKGSRKVGLEKVLEVE